ncbi:hypothetical protein EDC04DRAFT_2654066 [Pisolithus marmoratus]|nr:hypothetical protein EDC04DRAFT_2654066 [Pisolithus marmoratus]
METIESLVQERVTQLRAVAQRRNELLQQMYYMIRHRHRAGSIMELDQMEDDGLQEFMDRFDLDKNPDSGMVSNLSEDDLFVPFLLPSDTDQDANGDDDIDIDSPMSESPMSPRPARSWMSTSPRSRHDLWRKKKKKRQKKRKRKKRRRNTDQMAQRYHPPGLPRDICHLSAINLFPIVAPVNHYFTPPRRLSPRLIGDTVAEDVVSIEAIETPQITREPSPQSIYPPSPILVHKEPESQQPMVIHTAVDALLIPTPTSPAPTYTLPPPKFLPPDFLRKAKSSKQRKQEWAPLGFVKWGALIRANPVYKKVSRAVEVAITELRMMRTLERWSYRQPKKQRNLGGMTKTHWDYLLDEMVTVYTNLFCLVARPSYNICYRNG